MSEIHVEVVDLPIPDVPCEAACCHDQDRHAELSHANVIEHQRFVDIDCKTEDLNEESHREDIVEIPTPQLICRLTTANLELFGIVEEASAREKCRNFLFSCHSVADISEGVVPPAGCEAPGAPLDTRVKLTDVTHYQANNSNRIHTVVVQPTAPRYQVYEQRTSVAKDSQLRRSFCQFTFIGFTNKRCPGCSMSFLGGTHVGSTDYIQVRGTGCGYLYGMKPNRMMFVLITRTVCWLFSCNGCV
jgi:hypothetical protein